MPAETLQTQTQTTSISTGTSSALQSAAPLVPAEQEQVDLLDGGEHAFPRMLAAIGQARQRIYLEVYSFELDKVGNAFIEALQAAARRHVEVNVILDGWGSLLTGRRVAALLSEAGCKVTIYNRFSTLLLGRLRRDHRKLLMVDERVAFIGGINIGDDYATEGERLGWADLAVELHGPSVPRLAARLRGEPWPPAPQGGLRVHLSGLGGGGKLRKRYLKAFGAATRRILLAHAYFLPNHRLLRSLTAAARRGVKVQLLLAGRSDVAFAHAATMRLYRYLLQGGVEIFEWDRSVLHAKASVVDGDRFLVGSFNLDPLSLADLEALVEIRDPAAVSQGEQWISSRLAQARQVTLGDCHRSALQRLVLDVFGLWAARIAEWVGRILSRGERGRISAS
jgi:cardiolipin synthase